MEKDEKIKKKTAEERAENHEADNLLNYIIGSTFARHSKLSEEEFLKDVNVYIQNAYEKSQRLQWFYTHKRVA